MSPRMTNVDARYGADLTSLRKGCPNCMAVFRSLSENTPSGSCSVSLAHLFCLKLDVQQSLWLQYLLLALEVASG
jgi:hypothetical protein